MNLLIRKIEQIVFPCSGKIRNAFHSQQLAANALHKTLEKAKVNIEK